jgi:hypothetical protein
MKIWDKLDEVMGAGMLAGIACMAMWLNVDGGVVTAATVGIVTLLASSKSKKE